MTELYFQQKIIVFVNICRNFKHNWIKNDSWGSGHQNNTTYFKESHNVNGTIFSPSSVRTTDIIILLLAFSQHYKEHILIIDRYEEDKKKKIKWHWLRKNLIDPLIGVHAITFVNMWAPFSGKVRKMFWHIREERKITRSLNLTWHHMGSNTWNVYSNPEICLGYLWNYKENH